MSDFRAEPSSKTAFPGRPDENPDRMRKASRPAYRNESHGFPARPQYDGTPIFLPSASPAMCPTMPIASIRSFSRRLLAITVPPLEVIRCSTTSPTNFII